MRTRWWIKSKFLPLDSKKKKKKSVSQFPSWGSRWWMMREAECLKPQWITVVTEIMWAAPEGKTDQQTSQRHDANCWGGREINNNNNKRNNMCLKLRLSGHTNWRWEKQDYCKSKNYPVVAKSTKRARAKAMKGESRRGRQREAGPSLSLSLLFFFYNKL